MDLQSILNKIITNTELYNKFINLNSQEEIYKFLSENGYNEDYEFFCEQLDNVKNDFKLVELEGLENSELDKVSGGANLKQVFKAGGAGLLASAMAFGGLGANATKLSDQCIDLASNIASEHVSSRGNIINKYDKSIGEKTMLTVGTMLIMKHMLNNNIFKNINNLFDNKVGDTVLVGFISSYIDYVNTRLRLVRNIQQRSIDPNTVSQKLSDVIKFIEALAQKNGINPDNANLYRENLHKIKGSTPFDYVDQQIQVCINSVMNINKELSDSIFEFGLNLINESEMQSLKNSHTEHDSKKLIEVFLKNPKTAAQELTKLFNDDNKQHKAENHSDNSSDSQNYDYNYNQTQNSNYSDSQNYDYNYSQTQNSDYSNSQNYDYNYSQTQNSDYSNSQNYDYNYNQTYVNSLSNFGECYKNCIIKCYNCNNSQEKSDTARISINLLIESIKTLAQEHGVSDQYQYNLNLNNLNNMSQNSKFDINKLITCTKLCFGYINNKNIQSLESDIYDYGVNLQVVLGISSNYKNCPAPFTDNMRDVAKKLEPLFKDCYRAYNNYYKACHSSKNSEIGSYEVRREACENLKTKLSHLLYTMDKKYEVLTSGRLYPLMVQYNNINSDVNTDDTMCSCLSDIWNYNIRSLVQRNSDIKTGEEIYKEAREEKNTDFFFNARQNINLNGKKTNVTNISTDTKLFNSNIFNKLYDDCKIDNAIKFFSNTADIPTSKKCQNDILPFMYNIEGSINVIKNILNTINNSVEYKEIVDKLGMSNDLETAVKNVESCYNVASNTTQCFLFKTKQDETARYSVHDWLINKANYNKNLSNAIEFINNFFNAYNPNFNNLVNLTNNFKLYNTVLEQRSKENWCWYHGKDDPKTKEFEKKFENFKETDDFMLELCELRNEYMESHFLYNYKPLFEKFEQLLNKYNVDISDLNYVSWISNFDGKIWNSHEELLKEIQQDKFVKQREYLENLWKKTFNS